MGRRKGHVCSAAPLTLDKQLEYSIYIGAIAVTLLNFGPRATPLSLWTAGVFTLLAVLSLCYSVGIYLYRSRSIRERRAARYYDKWGPSALCAALLVAVVLNFASEGRGRGLW